MFISFVSNTAGMQMQFLYVWHFNEPALALKWPQTTNKSTAISFMAKHDDSVAGD